jgi:long-chain fatty acid transport protein
MAAASLTGAACLCASSGAFASNPLEYPDNGAASFARGGAWLAVGNEPIAAHYNPAALATQGSGFSIEQQLNFDHVCYDRRGPGNTAVGPNDATTLPGQTTPAVTYLPVCNSRGSFPSTIPSISVAWRASRTLGFGIAIVPPATYGTPKGAFPLTAPGYNGFTKSVTQIPAPYRYMQTDNQSTIIFPTASFGWEVVRHLRVGAGFISGIAVIDVDTVGGTNNVSPTAEVGDHQGEDGLAHLLTKDLFVPGVVASIHWSVLPQLDISVWGRWMDSVRASEGDFTLTAQVYDGSSGKVTPTCTNPDLKMCTTNATQNHYLNALTAFKYPIPPEIRIGARFHQPRSKSRLLWETGGEVRDPLHDDSFDVEVDGSYSMNSKADNVQIRFNPLGVEPTGVNLPPNADKPTGYKDSYGVRVGGQWNAVQSKFAVRAGGWFESQSVDPAYESIFPVGATRWGFGGGIVFRQDFIDISLGYQRHLSSGQNNNGDGKMLIPVGTSFSSPFNYRSIHTVNGGHITENAHAFSLGGTVHF